MRGSPRRLLALALTWAVSAGGVGALTTSSVAHAADPEPYKNTALPFSVRAADLVSRMTLEEKYNQLAAMQPHVTSWGTLPRAIERLGVRRYGYWGEANHGIYFPVLGGSNQTAPLPQGLGYTMWPQSKAMASTWNYEANQKMGDGIADEARITYNATCPPGEAGLQRSDGTACFGLTYWSPNQNLNRDPRWGRADEAFTEDPFLAGEVASAFVKGLQGNTASRPDTVPTGPDDYVKAVATPKHYLGNNSEANRNYGTSNITERSMHEYFLPPFAASAGDAGARSLMTAYNAVSVVEDYTTDYPSAASYPTQWSPRDNATPGGTPGTPAASSRYTIETLLRRSYGFDGFIVSDCDAITRVWEAGTRGHSWQPVQLGGATRINKAQGDAWALKAGTDLDCSGGDYPSATGLTVSQSQGLATEADVDIALVRAFTARFQMGEFDPVAAVPWNHESYSTSNAGDAKVKLGSNAHRATAHESALEAPVLLKNDGTLPFTGATTGKTVALGHFASLNLFQGGSYSGPTAVNTTFAQALAAYTGGSTTDVTAQATTPVLSDHLALYPDVLNSAGNAIMTSVCGSTPCDPVADAATAEYRISQADNIVVVVGHRNNDGGEGSDRATIVLPRMQAELIRDSIAPLASKYGKKIAVWIQAKTIVDVSLFKDLPAVGAIVWSSFNGMYQGRAMAELLFNDTVTLEDGREVVANFSGKLPLTWYSDVEAQLGPSAAPDYAIEDYRMTKAEGSKCGRTYLYYQVGAGCDAPHYVFGHGLSYSPFVYGTPTLSASTITPNQSVTVSVPVSNQVANNPGKAVVEVYAKAPTGADGNQRPLKQLKGFAKSGVITGSPETVQVTIDAGDLWFWDDVNHKKVFPTGDWTILAGPSSADADLKSVTLTVTGERTGGVEVVSAQPDGTELSLDTPDNRINALLSVTKHDMSFWNLSDSALKVEYTSSNPLVASVDAAGVVAPVAVGAALITAKATADGESKSTTFPVVVTSGVPDATGTVFANAYTRLVNFGDIRVRVEAATSGVQLSANVVPADPAATYSYQIAPMDTNTAGASVTSDGILTASKVGQVRVTVTADAGGVRTSESALIRIVPTVNKDALQAAVTAGTALQADQYTTSSWTAADLATVLASAQAVLDNPDATQAVVDAETDTVNAAMAALVRRGDSAVLAALIATANSLDGKLGGFTTGSVEALRSALTSATAVHQDRADKTQVQLDAAATELQSALAGLAVSAPTVDKAVLQHAYDAARAMTDPTVKYTAASWAKLQAEVADAKAVLDNASATQAAVDTALRELSSALAGLVFSPVAVDKAVLQHAYDAARAMTDPTVKYTAASWAKLQAEVADAKAVLDNASATQAAVDTALRELSSGLAGLELKPVPVDKAVLQHAYDAGKAMADSAGKYMSASWAKLQAELADAKAVLDNASATQAAVDAAAKELSSALASLELKPVPADKAVLSAVYASARALSNSGGVYTAGSWAKLQTELAKAQAVLGSPSATQAQINTAAAELNAAVAGLVPVKGDGPTRLVVAKVKLNQSQLRLVKGKSFTLEEAVYYASASAKPAYVGKVTWKSSRTDVATVSSNGVVKAKKTGTATITVTSTETNAAGKKLSTSIKVTVVKSKGKSKVTSVTAGVPKTMKLGQTVYITGKYSSSKATGVKVKYSSSKPDIVLIDKVGRMVATSKGTEKIKVTAGGKTKTYTVTVK